jgi:hypothetical protein
VSTQKERLDLVFTRIGNFLRDSVLTRVLPTGGTAGQVLSKVNANNFNATWTTPSTTGGNPVLTDTFPATPGANQAALFARSFGRVMLGGVTPDGDAFTVQPHFGRNRINLWQAAGNSATISFFGLIDTGTNIGTAGVNTTPTTTNHATRMRRWGNLTSNIAGNLSGRSFATGQFFSTGNGAAGNAAMGGFFLSLDFVPSTPVLANAATARMFLGMIGGSTATTNVEPTSVLNVVGVGKISTSSNLHIIVNGSAAQAPIDLGADFPANTNRVDAYRATFYSSPNLNGVISWRVERIGTDFVASGTITPVTPGVQTPISTLTMAPRWWITNNLTAAIVGLDIGQMYIESEN